MYRVLLIPLIIAAIFVTVVYVVLLQMGSLVNNGPASIKDYQFSIPYSQLLNNTWKIIGPNKHLKRAKPEPGYNNEDYYNDSIRYITCVFIESDSSESKFVFHFIGDSTSLATSPTSEISLKYVSNSKYNSNAETDHLIKVFEQELIEKLDISIARQAINH